LDLDPDPMDLIDLDLDLDPIHPSLTLFGTLGRRVFRILAIEGSNLPSLLIGVKNNTVIANLTITIARLNVWSLVARSSYSF